MVFQTRTSIGYGGNFSMTRWEINIFFLTANLGYQQALAQLKLELAVCREERHFRLGF